MDVAAVRDENDADGAQRRSRATCNVRSVQRAVRRARRQLGRTNHRGPLPEPFYYLHGFQAVLLSIEVRYAELLSLKERQFIVQFGVFPQAARFAGPYGHASRRILSARPIELCGNWRDVLGADPPLLEAGWVEADPMLDVTQLARLVTRLELIQHVSLPRRYRHVDKSELVDGLCAAYPDSRPFSGWCLEHWQTP